MKNPAQRLLGAIAITAIIVTTLTVPTWAATYNKRDFRVGIGLSEQHPQGRAVAFLAERLRERTNGQWNLTLFAAGKLGNDLTMVGDLQSGKLDFSAPDTSVLSKFESGFSLLNLPYEFESELEASRALDGRFGDQLAQSLEKHGLIGLGYWENGFRHVTNSRHPLKAAADFRALNIRVMQNPVFIDAFQSLGATTTPLPFNELFGAMKTGKVEAQENPPITILNERFYEVQKYMTLTRHSYSAWLFMMSKKVWDQLNADERQLLKEATAEARDYERKLIRQDSRNAIDALRARGMDIVELQPVELSRVRLLIREKTAAHKAKIDPAWRNNLYMGRLDDILTKLDQPKTEPAPGPSAGTAAKPTALSAEVKKKS